MKSSGRIERLHEEFKRRITTVLPPQLLEGGGNSSDVVLGFAGFARWTAAEASTKVRSIRRLTSPHDRVTSSRWRLRQNQCQYKSRRHGTFRCGELYLWMTVRKSFGTNPDNF
jgi:hypothetical protein